MNWRSLSADERRPVIELLLREAERLERDMLQVQEAAARLGRPSLIDRQEARATAYRAAIAALSVDDESGVQIR